MKKLLAILLAVLMVFTVVACGDKEKQGNNDDEQYKDKTVIKDSETLEGSSDTFYYENVDSETVIIVGFSTTNDAKHTVHIPAYFVDNGGEDPLRVVGIGKEAFNCSSSVETLVFPTEEQYRELDADFDMSKHTFTIADFALRECVSLTTLSFPAYVTEIGVGAFFGCVALDTLTFEAGSRLTKIADTAFMDCTALQNVELPGSLQSIGAAAFFECTALESVVINEGTLTIGEQAFQKCSALANVELPASLETIGDNAFHSCASLYLDGWKNAGVPVKPGDEVDENSDEYKEYLKALAEYNASAVKAYEDKLGLVNRDGD